MYYLSPIGMLKHQYKLKGQKSQKLHDCHNHEIEKKPFWIVLDPEMNKEP
jgi:hypothetical protein